MRLYPRMGQKIVCDPEHGRWGLDEEDESRRPDAAGGFDFPDELSDRLVRFHHRGRPLWETEEQRNVRTIGEERARRRDPETLYGAVEDIANITRQLAGLQLGPAQPHAGTEVAALRAQVEELRAQLAEMEGRPALPGDSGAKPVRSRKTAPTGD